VIGYVGDTSLISAHVIVRVTEMVKPGDSSTGVPFVY